MKARILRFPVLNRKGDFPCSSLVWMLLTKHKKDRYDIKILGKQLQRIINLSFLHCCINKVDTRNKLLKLCVSIYCRNDNFIPYSNLSNNVVVLENYPSCPAMNLSLHVSLSNLQNEKTKESMCTIHKMSDINSIANNNQQIHQKEVRVQQLFNCGECMLSSSPPKENPNKWIWHSHWMSKTTMKVSHQKTKWKWLGLPNHKNETELVQRKLLNSKTKHIMIWSSCVVAWTLQRKVNHGSFSNLTSTVAFLALEDMVHSASSSAGRLLLPSVLSVFVGVVLSSVCDSSSFTWRKIWVVQSLVNFWVIVTLK